MKKCKEYQEHFIEVYYNELPVETKQEIVQHIASCSVCANEYKNIEATLFVMNKRTRTEPDEAYWQNYWKSLNNALEQETIQTTQSQPKQVFHFSSVPSWAYGIAAMLLIGVGLYLGKIFYSPEVPVISQQIESPKQQMHQEDTTEIIPPQQEERKVESLPRSTATLVRDNTSDDAREYLDRSKVMLLGIINSDEDSPVDLARQKKVSRALLKEAVDLKPKLIEPNQKRIKQLIDELEVILLQLANIEEQTDVPAIELVKKGVDQKSILLKINMEEMRMQKGKENAKKLSKKDNTRL